MYISNTCTNSSITEGGNGFTAVTIVMFVYEENEYIQCTVNTYSVHVNHIRYLYRAYN